MGAKLAKQKRLSMRDRPTVRAPSQPSPSLHSPGSEPAVSGTRRRITTPQLARHSVPTDNSAYAEMQRAVGRGVCRILANVVDEAGTHHVWSAWLIEGGQLNCQQWMRRRKAQWTKGSSFTIEPDAVETLAELLCKIA